MLGFVMVRNLVIGNGVAAAFRHTKGIDLQQFWRYNLYAACASRWLASSLDLNSDLVFTVGLMHGIGQLHLHAAAPEAMVSLDQATPVLSSHRAAAEQATLGFHNGTLSAELAQLWHFPAPISEALRRVVEPLAPAPFSAEAACVHLGCWRARQAIDRLSAHDATGAFPQAVAQRLGVTESNMADDMPPLTELAEGLEAMFE